MRRRTIHAGILLVWLILFFLLGFGVWSFQGGELMVLGYLILSVVVYVLYAFLTRCLQCRMPLLLRPVNILGMRIFIWSLLTPAVCRHCGAPVP